MANFYVSVARGSDATGDGSAANPWKSINRAIGSPPAAVLDPASPNTVYLEPGVYRETVVLGASPSAAGPLRIVGDSDGAGFAAGGFAAPAAGLVEWRAWTNETTVAGAACLSTVAKGDFAVERVKFIGGQSYVAALYIQGGQNIAFRDCIFIGHYKASDGVVLQVEPTAGTPPQLVVERCEFMTLAAGAASIAVYVPLNATDWSLDSRIVNCAFRGASNAVVLIQQYGSGDSHAGGLAVQNCTFLGTRYGVQTSYGSATPSPPFTVSGCLFAGASLNASGSGQIIEDGNVFMCSEANSNVAAGPHSLFDACPAIDFGDDRLTGLPLRPFGTPSAGSVFAGFGAYGSPPADDLTGRSRPEGTGSTVPALGCLERHDTGVKNAVFQDVGSSACLALVGPSSQERLVLVDAVAINLKVKVRWDGNHGDANKPQAVLIAEPQIGVAGQTVTAVSAGGSGTTPNAYETLTFAPFTPTGKGAVMLRLVSRAAAGNGVAYFDSITLS